MDPMEEQEEGEVRKEDFENGLGDPNGPEVKVVNLNHHDEEQNDMILCRNLTPSPSQLMLNKKKPSSKRDIRTLNYAFGEPRIDEAAKEAQDWFDTLAIGEEDENDSKRNIFPHGLKYRSALANLSPQMFERLQRCQENQEPYNPPKNRIMSTKKNSSIDVHVGLHEEDHYCPPQNLWKGRRSAAGNTSSSVYAILHPQAETSRCKRKTKSIDHEKNPNVRRNYVREHIAAIAEMSFLTHNYKEKEKNQEAKQLNAIKHWGDRRQLRNRLVKRQPNVKTNFMEKNMETIKEQSASIKAFKEEPRPDVLLSYKENIGRVPEYLQRIKIELAQEAERRELEETAKSFPPGRRLMSDMNRRHVLQKLENKHKELIHTLKSFPLIFDTPRQIQLKSNIEQQLRNIEASHKYYDNPRVYISCLDINCPTCMHMDNHFFHDSWQKTPSSHNGDIWEHMAYAAGIQKSPLRRKTRSNFETGAIRVDNNRVHGITSLPKKRRNHDGDVYISPSKRQNTSPKMPFLQFHTSRPFCLWGICKKCSTPI